MIIFFIYASRGTGYNDFLRKFLLIKQKEEQHMIGKCWSEGEADDVSGEIDNEIHRFL